MASNDKALMQAIVARCYGGPEVMELATIVHPTPADDEVLVKVHAASVNPLDWHYMRGSPYFMRLMAGLGKPNRTSAGVDFAGTVVGVGKNVSAFKPGDDVFGGAAGAFAEFLTVKIKTITQKPANVSFEQAAAIPIAGVTALQALRDSGQLEKGQKVLINGASGGVGTFAVQIAKVMGAEVTGVCSTRNVEMVLDLGADHVIDYKIQNYTESDQRFDLIVDNVANHPISDIRKVLKPNGRLVLVGGPKGDWIGAIGPAIKANLVSPFVSQEISMILAELLPKDLAQVAAWIQVGQVRSVIDRRYPLSDVSDAMRYSETGRARGKIVITVERGLE